MRPYPYKWVSPKRMIGVGVLVVLVIATAGFLGILSKDKVPVVKSNDEVAMDMLNGIGYNPKAVTVSEVIDGVYCGEFFNETNSVWFRISDQGLNVFNNGNVYFSTTVSNIKLVNEGIDSFIFQQDCSIRSKRDPLYTLYEDSDVDYYEQE